MADMDGPPPAAEAAGESKRAVAHLHHATSNVGAVHETYKGDFVAKLDPTASQPPPPPATIGEVGRALSGLVARYQPLQETIFQWLPKYNRAENLMGDIISGLSVGIMLVPQGMAHAAIAASNPVMGLYAALLPVIVYACLGSSRHLAPGSGALVALLIADSVDKVAVPAYMKGVGCGLLDTNRNELASAAAQFPSAPSAQQFSSTCSRVSGIASLCDVYFGFDKVCQGCADACFVSNPGAVNFEHQTQSLGYDYTGAAAAHEACLDRCLESSRWDRALQLSLAAGATLTGLGCLNFGYVVNFFSGPLLAGFTVAGGVSIFSGQLKNLFGEDPIEVRDACAKMFGADSFSCESPRAYVTILSWLYALPTTGWSTLVLGAACLCGLQAFRTAKQTFGSADFKKAHTWAPYAKTVCDFGVLWVVIVATGIAYHAEKEKTSWRFQIVGPIPKGLPKFEVPSNWDKQVSIADTIGDGILIGLVSFLSSIVVAKKFANKFGYELYSSQELVALGLANVVGSFFGAFPVQGSLSRTAVNAQNGKTQLASLICATVVGISLVVLTEVAFYLPKAVLAAIIMLACQELLDLTMARDLHHNKMYLELGIFWLSTFATIILGILPGVLLGIACSLAMVISRAAMPNVVELARLPGTRTYRATYRYEMALRTPGVVIVRFDAPIFFANVEFFQDKVKDIVENAKTLNATGQHGPDATSVEKGRDTHWTDSGEDMYFPRKLDFLILVFSAVTDCDSTGCQMLRDFVTTYKKEGITVICTNLMGNMRRIFFRAGVVDVIGKRNFFMDVHSAVRFCARANSATKMMDLLMDVQGREVDWETLPDVDEIAVSEAATTVQRYFRGFKIRKGDLKHAISTRRFGRSFVQREGIGPSRSVSGADANV